MKKRIKTLICGICLICCLGMLAGCGENNVSPAATPGPTNTAAELRLRQAEANISGQEMKI